RMLISSPPIESADTAAVAVADGRMAHVRPAFHHGPCRREAAREAHSPWQPGYPKHARHAASFFAYLNSSLRTRSARCSSAASIAAIMALRSVLPLAIEATKAFHAAWIVSGRIMRPPRHACSERRAVP